MNSQKPARVRICREATCGQEFEVTIQGQRYCPTCREARAEAAALLRASVPAKPCTQCGVESHDRTRGLCPTCEAARLAEHKQWLDEWNRERKQRRQEEKQPNAPIEPPASKPEPTPAAQDDDGDVDSADELAMVLIVTLVNFLGKGKPKKKRDDAKDEAKKEAKEEAQQDDSQYEDDDLYGGRFGYGVRLPKQKRETEGANPEEEVHDDQDAIDAAFDQLMEGFDL